MSTITLHDNDTIRRFTAAPGRCLLDVLREQGVQLSAPCGGNGTCGKCRVTLCADGAETDVLACRTLIRGDCAVRFAHDEGAPTWNETSGSVPFEAGRSGLGAAVDLGTTTVVLKLYDLSSGECLGSADAWNVQRSFGADVISRIGFCIDRDDGLSTLSRAIRTQVWDMVCALCRQSGVPASGVTELVVAGNTVMQHIFAGISPNSIASAPFTPATLFDEASPFALHGAAVRFAPCAAGYVGGDIMAGLLAAGLARKSGRSLFIDVGTNGEMALGGKDGFTVCAVASGPAFEGAGITCGMSASPGAIRSVSRCGDRLTFDVIGGGEAKGICGSGLLDLAACLLDMGYIDESGCLAEDETGDGIFRLTREVYLTQQDVRRLQLAKAAVAAGIRRLMDDAGADFSSLDALYLAGGFANCLRAESAVRIGMLPRAMLGKIVLCGNSSLAGAERVLGSPSLMDELRAVKDMCRYIELSSDRAFADYFVEEMGFPEEE